MWSGTPQRRAAAAAARHRSRRAPAAPTGCGPAAGHLPAPTAPSGTARRRSGGLRPTRRRPSRWSRWHSRSAGPRPCGAPCRFAAAGPACVGKWARHDVPQACRLRVAQAPACWSASAARSARRARWQRDLMVPSATPSSTAASAQVRPSSTVASMAPRNSGDSSRQGLAQATVLNAGQHLILGGDNHRWFGCPPRRPPLQPALPADRVDQATDADAPDERGHVAGPAVAACFPPQGEEGVLDRVVDDIRHARIAGSAGRSATRRAGRTARRATSSSPRATPRSSAASSRSSALRPHARSRSRTLMHSLSQQGPFGSHDP